MNSTSPRIVFIGDFNLPDIDKIEKWSNINNLKPEFRVYRDPQDRMTSHHTSLWDKETDTWSRDPNFYQKVDHLMKNGFIDVNELDVYCSNNGNLAKADIANKLVPYKDISNPPYTPNTTFNWQGNHLIINNGWPSDHTFNVYSLTLLDTARYRQKYIRYKINY